MEIIAAAILLATFVEGFVEYLFSGVPEKARKYLKYVALVFGIIVALLFNIDLLASVFGIASAIPFVGQIMSGLVIGRGSNYVHDFLGSRGSTSKDATVTARRQPVIRQDLQVGG